MNAPDDDRRLRDEFDQFKELLRKSGPTAPQRENAEPQKPDASRPATPDDLLASFDWSGAQERAPEPVRAYDRPRGDDGATGLRRPVYLAAAALIVAVGLVAAGAYILDAPLAEPEAAAIDPNDIAAPQTADEKTPAEAPASRDAAIENLPPAVGSADPLTEGARAEPAAPGGGAIDDASRPPAEPIPPEAKHAPAAALPADALAPVPVAPPAAPAVDVPVPPPPPAPARPAVAAPQKPGTSAPKAAAPAKQHERSKPAQTTKPAKPKGPEPAAKAKPGPAAEAPAPALPPPAPVAAEPHAAPSEPPGIVERAVDSVTGAVKDIGKITGGVIP